jgi:nucleotide-binding universal stress UspA family protein
MANKLITLATLEHINQASMMKEWLESAGIESYLLDHGLSVEGASQMEGEIELQVCEPDAAKALEVLGNMEDQPQNKLSSMEIPAIKKILVPVDFSDASFNAACYGIHVARQKGAEITLIHVYFNPVTDPIACDHFYAFPTSIAETLNEIIENARGLMDEFREKLNTYITRHEIPEISINTELVGGIAEEAILDFAKIKNFDLLIIGIRGKAEGENWLGSFMSEIINKAQIPVLAIPESATYKEQMFKRVMYATNFDKSDGNAIRELIKIARPLETHISIVHIDDTNDNPFINYDLAHFKEKFVGETGQVRMKFDLIVSKNLARGIENYISEHQMDIISVTSHKRNLITSLFRPSLTKELLFRLDIPMLIFHAKN